MVSVLAKVVVMGRTDQSALEYVSQSLKPTPRIPPAPVPAP